MHPPTLIQIGAPGLLADCDEFLPTHEALDLFYDLGSRNTDLQPIGALAREDRGACHPMILTRAVTKLPVLFWLTKIHLML